LDFNFGNENLNGNPLQNPYVQSEIRKVNDSQKELTTRIINVTKTFYPCCACCRKGKVRAINHLHLGLEPNEKFGLLGFNGSGKTTTFRAITNEITTDAGSINIFGYDTKKQFNYIRTIIGYCPQINPLFDFMKVKEIIEFYSKLKTCNESAEVVCEKFGLSKYLDSYTVNLSGGNKRKLTFAIAMMNRPSLLLLDEPSTGVDPESRRIMWKNINELSNTGHKYNMILTTHSMEEAEILCDTVSWFRAGNFITLGNPEELKLKYSAGYKLHIKFDEMKIKSQEDDNMENSLNILANYIEGFNNYIDYFNKNPMFGPYLKPLINVIKKIRNKTSKISLYIIGKDYSFELIIQIINEKKKELFSEILSMKNNDKTIDELTITMQSLENILTSI
jgi:ABC-type multidrug transport system ATPase subunit